MFVVCGCVCLCCLMFVVRGCFLRLCVCTYCLMFVICVCVCGCGYVCVCGCVCIYFCCLTFVVCGCAAKNQNNDYCRNKSARQLTQHRRLLRSLGHCYQRRRNLRPQIRTRHGKQRSAKSYHRCGTRMHTHTCMPSLKHIHSHTGPQVLHCSLADCSPADNLLLLLPPLPPPSLPPPLPHKFTN